MRKIVFVALVAMLGSQAYAQVYVERCEKDSLNVDQAFGRIEWTRGCAREHVVRLYKKSGLPQKNVPEGQMVSTIINDWLFFKGQKRTKPVYPIFTQDASDGPQWIAPSAADKGCKVKVPANMSIYTTCVSSCYHPDEEVLFESGFVPVPEAKQENLNGLMVLGDSSTIGSVELRPKDVHTYVESRTETEHKLVKLTMASGKQLRVTANHPLLDGKGYMREASSLATGDSLLDKTGQPEEIAAIELEDYFGKVYNLQPDTASLKGNVIVAGGYLSGSNWYQNGGFSHVGSRILRESIPAELVEP